MSWGQPEALTETAHAWILQSQLPFKGCNASTRLLRDGQIKIDCEALQFLLLCPQTLAVSTPEQPLDQVQGVAWDDPQRRILDRSGMTCFRE